MKKLFLLFLIASLVYPVHAQSDPKIKRNKFFAGKEGFREAWKCIKKGNEFYKKGKGYFQDARQLYLEAYNYNPLVPELNYKLGICYLFTDDKFQAIEYLRSAWSLKPAVTKDILFYVGRAYHQVLNFDSAIVSYQNYFARLPNKEKVLAKAMVDKLIQECYDGKKLVANPVRVIISDLGEGVNSEYDDYGPALAPNDSLMYFTSRRPISKKAERNPYDNKYYEDIYVAKREGTGWTDVKPVGKPLNTRHNDAVVGITPSGDALFIYRGKMGGGDILQAWHRRKKDKFTAPFPVNEKFLSRYRETSICMTNDSTAVYFVSDNPSQSMGGKDIFMSTNRKKGTERWKKPVNIGPVINTPYDEEGVYITPDGKTLYFSSKGHNTMGGYDVFRSVKLDDGGWSAPENLGYPINTPDDELFYRPDVLNPKYAYYSAVREGGRGGKDIFRIAFLGEEKELILVSDTNLFAWRQAFPPKAFTRIPDYLSIDSTLVITGKVTDASTGKGLMARIEFIDVGASKTVATVVSDTSGNYRASLPAKTKYGVEIMAKDYLFFLEMINLAEDTSDVLFVRNFALNKVEVGTKVVLRNIFFETGKATLKPESYAELSNVLRFMEDNPTVRLEISGHTDNVGSRKLNEKLSKDRAKAVVDYLVSKGIDSSRLESKGYADTQPVATNATAEGRALNRRVEFKVIGK